jgi:hypothetical protein
MKKEKKNEKRKRGKEGGGVFGVFFWGEEILMGVGDGVWLIRD